MKSDTQSRSNWGALRQLKWRGRIVVLCLAMLPGLVAADEAKPADSSGDDVIVLHTRQQVEMPKRSGRYRPVDQVARWAAKETAIVVCDMWDKHWCQGASRRVAEMAPRMNETIVAARKRGVLIIHAPSECMKFYADTPQRKLAQSAPKVEPKADLDRRRLDPTREPALPIDDSDGGCDCEPQCPQGAPWTRQIATIKIEPGDAITDSAEAYYLMRARGIKNVIVMGVHTNMCVLGRPFSIRQMVYQGQNVALMRDMTDTMYNPRKKPNVSHAAGTDLVVEHIERHWCPTVTSGDFTGKAAARFAEDKRPHLAIVMAEDEYKTAETLPEFAAKELAKEFKVTLIHGDEKPTVGIPGLVALRDADVALISVRRRVVPKQQLQYVRDYVVAGKPLVGIRTASHAFAPLAGKSVPDGHDAWPEFDPEILGGHYTGHHGASQDPSRPASYIRALPDAAKHPILTGVSSDEFGSLGSLYKVSPLTKTTTPLLVGRTASGKEDEPVAWTNASPKGARVFYTSLGHPEDFKNAAFRRLLRNGVYWASGSR